MTVPEAPIDEHNLPPTRQYNVWSSRKLLHVDSEAQTHSVNESADLDLGTGAGCANPAHQHTAITSGDPIHLSCFLCF